jgi:hypothetical protein
VLPQRAAQPGGGGVVAALALSAAAGAGALFGAVCADLGGALDFDGCCAELGKIGPNARRVATIITGFAKLVIVEPSNLKIGRQIGQVLPALQNNLYQSTA